MNQEEFHRCGGYGDDPDSLDAGAVEVQVEREICRYRERRHCCKHHPGLQAVKPEVAVAPPYQEAEDQRDGCVDEYVPGVEPGHRPEGEGGESAEERPPPHGDGSPSHVGEYQEEEQEPLVEETHDVRVHIAPEHREDGVLVDGVLDRPGAPPEDIEPGVSDEDVIKRRGVREEERDHREPPVTVEEEVPEGIERDNGEAEHRREREVERDRRGHAGYKSERAVHPVADVVVDVQRPPCIPGVERRDGGCPHDRCKDRVVHELLGVGDARVDPAHLEHEEEGEQEGEVPGERRPQPLSREESLRCSICGCGHERQEGEPDGKAYEPQVPRAEREEEDRCRVCSGCSKVTERALKRRPDGEVEHLDDTEPEEHGDEKLNRQMYPPSRYPC